MRAPLTTASKLKKSYLIVVATVALLIIASQVGLHSLLRHQQSDLRILDFTGRQRMLSQRVVASIYGSRLAAFEANRKEFRLQNQRALTSLELFSKSHTGLTLRSEILNFGGQNSEAVNAKFAALEKGFNEFVSEASRQLSTFKPIQSNSKNRARFEAESSLLSQLAEGYLIGISDIAKTFQAESAQRVDNTIHFEFVLALIALLALGFESMAIFAPTVRYIQKTTEELANKASSLQTELRHRELLEEQLIGAQKMEAMGQLAAGIAHEINTPTQYINDNTRFLQDSFESLLPLLTKATQLAEASKQTTAEALGSELTQLFSRADVDYLKDEVPAAIAHSLDGIQRVSKIVKSMKEFAHPDKNEMSSVPIDPLIERTIDIGRNEWKYVAKVETELDPELEYVECYPNELSQAILNLIVNAAHALEDCHKSQAGVITISTRKLGDLAEIRVADNGSGIPADIQKRIFEPFFTTKESGRGTGQGLAIVRRIIEERLHGAVSLVSEQGSGTAFILRMPLTQHAETEQ